MGTFRCRGPPRTSAPTSVQVYSVVRELWAVRFGDAQGGRDFTRNNFRTRVVCDVICDLVDRDVLGAPRAEGRSIVAGRRGRRPLPAFRSTASFESCGPFGSGMPREEEISRGATSVPGGSFAMSSVLWWARRPRRAARMGTFRCRGPPRTSAPTSVQVYGAIRELWAVTSSARRAQKGNGIMAT